MYHWSWILLFFILGVLIGMLIGSFMVLEKDSNKKKKDKKQQQAAGTGLRKI